MSVYRRNRNGKLDEFYTIKVRFQGKQIPRTTGARTKAEAKALEKAFRAELRTEHAQEAIIGSKRRHIGTVEQIVSEYIAADCPNYKDIRRTGEALKWEKYHLSNALKWDGWPAPATAITMPHTTKYFEFRSQQIQNAVIRRGKDGRRSVTLEITALRGAFQWACYQGKMERNPLIGCRSFENQSDTKHCRERKPSSGDVLHTVVAYLMARSNLAGFGWLTLIQAFTGLRYGEAILLLAEPRGGEHPEPGYMTEKFLYVPRLKLRGKSPINPIVRLDDPERPYIRQIIDGARAWNLQRYPRDRYDGAGLRLIPATSGRPLGKSRLQGVLHDACDALGIVPWITPHSLRAYYCTARRCQGIDDNQIAHELNQRGGPELVRKTYGDRPLHWDGLANTFTWLPSSPTVPVAWQAYAPFVAMPEPDRKIISLP